MRKTQEERILDYMEQFGGITQLEALADCSVMRLASRISGLRKKGYPIESEWVTVHNRFGEACSVKRYKLREVEDNAAD